MVRQAGWAGCGGSVSVGDSGDEAQVSGSTSDYCGVHCILVRGSGSIRSCTGCRCSLGQLQCLLRRRSVALQLR